MKEKLLDEFRKEFDPEVHWQGDEWITKKLENFISQALDEYADWKIKECLPENTTVKLDGKDELYCEFFRCDKCNNGNITFSDDYCGGCGRKILSNKDKK